MWESGKNGRNGNPLINCGENIAVLGLGVLSSHLTSSFHTKQVKASRQRQNKPLNQHVDHCSRLNTPWTPYMSPIYQWKEPSSNTDSEKEKTATQYQWMEPTSITDSEPVKTTTQCVPLFLPARTIIGWCATKRPHRVKRRVMIVSILAPLLSKQWISLRVIWQIKEYCNVGWTLIVFAKDEDE